MSVHVCVCVASGSLHVVVISVLMKEFSAFPPFPPSLPATRVKRGGDEGKMVKAQRGWWWGRWGVRLNKTVFLCGF